MGGISPSCNVPANLSDVLGRSLNLKKRDHVARLVRLPELFLNELRVDSPAPIVKVIKGYNESVAEELDSYGQFLTREVIRIAELIDGGVKKSDIRSAVVRSLDEMLDPDIYEKRFDIFIGSIERHFSRYGIAFDIEKYRPDLYRTAAALHAINACRRIRVEIENELDMLALAEASEPSGSDRYQRLQEFVGRNDGTLKLLSLLVAVAGALVALFGAL